MPAGQVGKILGCPVVGIAGLNEKCDRITRELGFDAAGALPVRLGNCAM